ncbi:hypothetical protein [Parerythrobacter lacustris]|uniref:DUF2306 domain-containing protein n=1 Tax=Parerythrobacter lacustris TaxID=2969984 RepID=A0ABT1XSX6_9SPHN|nr:hypothetical protein [Parerythrobacter lacustris]MCR2834717.1 hypothetical protein [Parerythrobacter lacustris]
MATIAAPKSARVEGTRFFTVMAFVMSALIIAGFSLNLAMGRSSFGAPWPYHLHGMIFMGWIGLYLAQHVTIAGGKRELHKRLGQLAYLWIPLMVTAGTMIIVIVARTTGGPFFFAMNEFFVSNLIALFTFGGLALWALRVRRYAGWHRRLMLVAMSILTGPGLGRLLPAPLFMPNAWTILVCLTFVFPAIGMLVDLRRDGRVHPAYWWGMGINVGLFVLSMLLAYSPAGYALTEWLTAGTPGGERPMEAFLPPGFSM